MSIWPPPTLDDCLDDMFDEFGSNYQPRGYYQPGPAVLAASVLRWVPYDKAVSAVRGLLGASHEDLRHRLQQLSRSLSSVFFLDGKERQSLDIAFAVRQRFQEFSLFVCADRAPLAPALKAVNRAMTKVAATNASQDACDHFYDAVDELMQLRVVDGGIGPAVLNQAAFESAFGLQWVSEYGSGS